MARRSISSANNANRGSTVGWAPFLNHPAVRKGYNDVMTAAGWSTVYRDNISYEWGRLIACEVRQQEGSKAPVFIPTMQRITKEWKARMQRCAEFATLVRQHNTRQEYAA